MKVMLMVRNKEVASAPPAPPSTELLAEMGRFNELLVKSGVLLAGEGLLPSSTGKRVEFSGEKRTIMDGPFTEAKEVVGGFWIWEVKSMDEAVEWLKRCPLREGAVELRQIASPDDYAASDPTGELREAAARLRASATK